MLSYFEIGFGAYMANLSVGILVYLLLVKLFDIFFSKRFSPSWKYTIALAMTAVFLIPVKIYAPWTVIPLGTVNVPLYITSPEPILLDGITEVNGYFTGAEAKGEFLYTVLFYIWAAGAVVTFAWQMIKLGRLYRSVSKGGIPCADQMYKNILEKVCSEVKVKVPRLIIYPETDTPFAMGIISPKIILPPLGYSEKEIEYIFRHEVRHIKRKDIFIKLLLIIFRCINWFNPLVYIMVGNAFSDMEISCDEKTTEKFSDSEREEYSKTLLKGASGMKYPAVTTFLSPTARIIKKRIDAVMNIRKFGKAIPVTIAFISIALLSQTYYAYPDRGEYWVYCFTDPYPMEADPYITSEEWRTAEGDSASEAGEKIFRQYMEMYMGDDVPEYYRIKEYIIEDVYNFEENPKLEEGADRITKGILTSHDYVSFRYGFIPANECGNTVHNMNFGGDTHLNGVYNDCTMAFELEKKGNSYTVVNIGTVLTFGNTGYHFYNNLTNRGIIDRAEYMAQAGLLDYSWNDTDCLPDPDDICEYDYIYKKLFNEYLLSENPDRKVYSELFVPDTVAFGPSMSIDGDYIKTAGCIKKNADGHDVIDPEKLNLDESKGFEYCGYDIDLTSSAVVIYGNVTGENPHGVKFYLYVADNEEFKSYVYRRLHRVEVTDELFTPVEFHDSFDNIPLPEDMTEAAEILEYMKTPRDGCDFTVMDYNSITEEADGVYAFVRFKGRLDGQYSVDVAEYDDGYVKTKII